MEGGEIMVRGEGNEYKPHWSQHASLIVESSFLFINLNWSDIFDYCFS